MDCSICQRPIVLGPSAQERARKYGDHPAAVYTSLFTTHSTCLVEKRSAEGPSPWLFVLAVAAAFAGALVLTILPL